MRDKFFTKTILGFESDFSQSDQPKIARFKTDHISSKKDKYYHDREDFSGVLEKMALLDPKKHSKVNHE